MTDHAFAWHLCEASKGSQSPGPRSYHAQIALGDERILICGGVCSSTNTILKDCYLFSVKARAWTRVGDLPRGICHGHLVKYRGLLVLVGGCSAPSDSSEDSGAGGGFFGAAAAGFFGVTSAANDYEKLKSERREPEKAKVYALDQENGMVWIEAESDGDVPLEKAGSACLQVGDRAIVLHGGKCLGGVEKDVHFGSLRILDLPTMTWIAPVGKKGYQRVVDNTNNNDDDDDDDNSFVKPLPRCAHAGILLTEKRIAFIGGKNSKGAILDGCADIYDFQNNKWLRPVEVFGDNVIVDASCVAKTDVGTYCFMERNGDVNAFDANELVWDPSLVRCDNLHELNDDVSGRSMTLCGEILVALGGSKKDIGSRYRVGGYNNDNEAIATWITRLAPIGAPVVSKSESNSVLLRNNTTNNNKEHNPHHRHISTVAVHTQKVGVWDGGVAQAANAWNEALENTKATTNTQRKDFDRFSRNSFALGSDSAERAIEGINRISDQVKKEKKSSTKTSEDAFVDSREKDAMTRRMNELVRDLENEKQLREKMERMNEELTLELKPFVGRKNVNDLAKELESDREKLLKMTEDFKHMRTQKDLEYDSKFEALRLSENEREDARMCKKWKQIAETSGEKYDELLIIAQTQKEGLDELCDVFPGAKRYLDRAIPSLASMRIPRQREQIMPSWFSDDARSINDTNSNNRTTAAAGGYFGSSSFLGGFF